LRTESRNFAETPRMSTCSSAARSKSAAGPGWNGEPSKSTSVASLASPEASQFHIIQPVVV
jgi:hypothetical protein